MDQKLQDESKATRSRRTEAQSVCCPHCSTVLDQVDGALDCKRCELQFATVEAIPVLADSPVNTTDSLSEAEVSTLLEQVNEHGWASGLRALLLQLPEWKALAGHTEFNDPRGILTSMMVGGPHHTSVLCLGCTAGAVPFALAERFRRVTVCDLSLGRLRILEKHSAHDEYKNINFVCGGDTDYLPFCASRFDLVFIDTNAFQDSRLQQSSFWSEIARTLQPHGACFTSAHNRLDPRRLFGHAPEASQNGFLTVRFLRHMLGTVGLRCTNTYGVLPSIRVPEMLFDLESAELGRTLRATPRMRCRLTSLCLNNKLFVPAFGLTAIKNGGTS